MKPSRLFQPGLDRKTHISIGSLNSSNRIQQTICNLQKSKLNVHTHTHGRAPAHPSWCCGDAVAWRVEQPTGERQTVCSGCLQHSSSSIVTLLHSSHIIIPAAVTLQHSHTQSSENKHTHKYTLASCSSVILHYCSV